MRCASNQSDQNWLLLTTMSINLIRRKILYYTILMQLKYMYCEILFCILDRSQIYQIQQLACNSIFIRRLYESTQQIRRWTNVQNTFFTFSGWWSKKEQFYDVRSTKWTGNGSIVDYVGMLKVHFTRIELSKLRACISFYTSGLSVVHPISVNYKNNFEIIDSIRCHEFQFQMRVSCQ